MKAAIAKMKNNKVAGPSEVVVDMINAAGDAGILWITETSNAIIIPDDWCKNWMFIWAKETLWNVAHIKASDCCST